MKKILFFALALVAGVMSMNAQTALDTTQVDGIWYILDKTNHTATVTNNLSALAPTANTAVMQNYRQVLMLNFNVNLDFGTKHNEGWKRINNEDTESGILSGAK